jgi:hypothetical protein
VGFIAALAGLDGRSGSAGFTGTLATVFALRDALGRANRGRREGVVRCATLHHLDREMEMVDTIQGHALSENPFTLTSRILERVIGELGLPKPPPELHHFTSLEAAYRIIEDDNVRLSHAEYSNDQTEMGQAKEIIRTALRPLSGTPFFDDVFNCYEQLALNLDAYVFCTSNTEQDILSQWRAYGHDGKGVCLTLDTQNINCLVHNAPGLLRNNPVIYVEETQNKFVEAILDKGFHFHNSGEATARTATVSALVFTTPLMKASGFSEEFEWRLIFMPPEDGPTPHFGFHPRRDFLVPYIDLCHIWYKMRPEFPDVDGLGFRPSLRPPPHVPPLVPITKIMIGPSGHQPLNERAVGKLIKQGNRTVEVRRSQIPYRSFA